MLKMPLNLYILFLILRAHSRAAVGMRIPMGIPVAINMGIEIQSSRKPWLIGSSGNPQNRPMFL